MDDYTRMIIEDLASGRTPFLLMVCECSRRTKEEQSILGSYCLECWEVIIQTQECIDCKVSATEERLYVSTGNEKLPFCQKCYCLNLNSSVPVDESTIQKTTINEE